MKTSCLVALLLSMMIVPAAFGQTRDPGTYTPLNNIGNDPCPTYDSCTMVGDSDGFGNGITPTDSHSTCLPYMSCETKTTDPVTGKITFSVCTKSGEHACAYSQDDPNLCSTLNDRQPDCGRLSNGS